MNLMEAFEHLLKNWESQAPEFVQKYKSYKSKYLAKKSGRGEGIGEKKMREMLVEAGYTEEWVAPKKRRKKT
jgi:hypothetical protein